MKNPKKDTKKISIRAQVFFALLTVIVIMAAMFSPYGFYTNIYSIRNSVDERLKVAVNGVLELMPDNYHDRLLNGEIGDDEYKQLQKKLVDFKNRIDVTFLYAMIQKEDGKIFFTLDLEDPAFTEYENPSEDTLEVFQTKQPLTAQGDDNSFHVTSRTALIPFTSENGIFFVIGADLNVQNFRPLVLESLKDFAFLLGIGVMFVVLITLSLAKKISLPIVKLSEFTEKLGRSNFSPDIKMSDYLSGDMNKTGEVSALARSIGEMRNKLKEYIEHLETEIRARNLVESELKIAGRIQESFLPGMSFESEKISAAAFMKPAKEAGGDLYDFFELRDGRMCFAIGDVSGKGMSAALFMARVMTLIRASARTENSLVEMVNFINDMLSLSNESCTFVTFFICAYDAKSGVLEFVNCGHNPPYVKRSDGSLFCVNPKPNSILGVFEGSKFETESAKLERGETFICYTDGVNEAIASDGSFYGDKRMEDILSELPAGSSSSAIVKTLSESVVKFERGAEQSDDITVMAFSIK